MPEAPKYIKVRKVFDLSRLHLVLFGLSQLILTYSLIQSKWTSGLEKTAPLGKLNIFPD